MWRKRRLFKTMEVLVSVQDCNHHVINRLIPSIDRLLNLLTDWTLS